MVSAAEDSPANLIKPSITPILSREENRKWDWDIEPDSSLLMVNTSITIDLSYTCTPLANQRENLAKNINIAAGCHIVILSSWGDMIRVELGF